LKNHYKVKPSFFSEGAKGLLEAKKRLFTGDFVNLRPKTGVQPTTASLRPRYEVNTTPVGEFAVFHTPSPLHRRLKQLDGDITIFIPDRVGDQCGNGIEDWIVCIGHRLFFPWVCTGFAGGRQSSIPAEILRPLNPLAGD
jgi:hypothetical protein